MSRLIVRRLTAAIALVTVLCVAAPAMATPVRSHAKAPLVLGTGLFDQILSWLNSFLAGAEPKPQGSREKTGASVSGGETTDSSLTPLDDRGGMIDPNGGS